MRSQTAHICLFCRYLINLSIAVDVMMNTLLGGSPHETISSRLGRAESGGNSWARVICNALSKIFSQPEHCRRSISPGQYEAVDRKEEILDLGAPQPCHKEH